MDRSSTFRILTLGCKVNQYESELLREQLIAGGLTESNDYTPAELYIVNTCTVTAPSDAKCRKIIRHISKENPKARIIVTGCYAERDADILKKLPNVEAVIDNEGKQSIPQKILGNGFEKSALPFCVKGFEEHTRAFIKIQDGCDEFCAYCIIPFVRGRSRSRKIVEIIIEAERLVANGYKEIVLTGIHVGSFGKTNNNLHTLPDLISALGEINGLNRIRLSSIDPNEVNDALISEIANNPLACKHLHISLQSGSTKILKLMKRKYSADEFLNLIAILYLKIPDISISTDVMVGFPSESDEDFELSCALVEKAQFSKVHVFPFSPRKGTIAAEMPGQIIPEIMHERERRLIALSERTAISHKTKFIGRTMQVLVESKSGNSEGFTDNYLRTRIQSAKTIPPNDFIEVKIQKADSRFLYGIPS